jgi:serine/threonine protein kinase
MRCCHATKPTVLHLDLKSANIVISEARDDGGEDMRFAKVIDFGTARILESSASNAAMHITSLHVTDLWAAPELLQHSRASTHADVYSFGVVLWELLQATGLSPYGSESQRLTKPVLIQEIMANNIQLSLPDSAASRDAPSAVVELLVACTGFRA